MVLLCKNKALYVKACIIPNGVTDSQGDTLYTEDIKKIFTSFNNQDNFEIYHNGLPIQEVSLLENYISTADETIGTAVVPSGSWNAVIRVDNPDIQKGLLNGEFQGVSLNNRIATRCNPKPGQQTYSDIADAECVIPLFISFVKAGANGYGLHVMDYDAYILKSKSIEKKNKGAKRMAFDLLGGLKKLVQQAEADKEPVILKEDPKKEDEEEPVVEKEDTTEEEVKKEDEQEAEITKEDEEVTNEDDDFEARVTAIVEKILAEKLDSKEDTKDEEVMVEEKSSEEDTPKITKSKVIDTVESTSSQINNTNYYEMTGRDPLTGLPKK